MKLLGRDTIAASVFDLDDLDVLEVERDEDDQRKPPTVSEKVALAQAIAERFVGDELLLGGLLEAAQQLSIFC